MPMYQRRRPKPLVLAPRQSATPTGPEDLESPDSPETPGPDSPETPTPTGAVGEEPDSPDEESAPAIGSTAAPEASATSEASVEAPSSTDTPAQTTAAAPPPESSATSAALAPSSASPPSAATQSSSATPSSDIPQSPATTQSSDVPQSSITASETTEQPTAAPEITDAPSSTETVASSSVSTTTGEDVRFSSNRNSNQRPTDSVTLPESAQPEQTGSGGAGGAAIGNEPPQQSRPGPGPGGMSVGAEAALITFTVLGGIALLIGIILFLRRRRRLKQESQLRHADDAFNPSNTGSLHTPETVHVGGIHDSRSTTTNSLFAAATYERPETVSTDRNNSRIPKPQPTPNPFADPPLNKAYDVLRGRPRSTTLTDGGRESWSRNPFRDPTSERFDPFGELQEKARTERVRYMEELKLEQEMLEKERIALGAPDAAAARKGSGVTVEGYGVLDRSGDGRYPR